MLIHLSGVSRQLVQSGGPVFGARHTLTLRRFPSRDFSKEFKRSIFPFSLLFKISKGLNKIPLFLKDNSVCVFRNCVAQFEFVAAHRIRRGQQVFSLYSRLWDEAALGRLLGSLRGRLAAGGGRLLLGSAALSLFSWDKERIPEEEFLKHVDELEVCHKLKKLLLESKPGDESECKGPECQCPNCSVASAGDCWQKFIRDGDLIVWKMEEDNHKGSGLHCYKMFGRYNDVTANDFFLAFLDTDTRKNWDKHVVSLYVIESEPTSNSDVIYWETKWPSLFSNRDYVYKRRYKVDKERKLMTILNKSTEHHTIPVYANKTRVYEYWSFMVIKPISDNFNEPGIEFSLTYFDNPGTSLPTAISHWVSATGMPNYLKKLRLAALDMASKRTKDPIPIVTDEPGGKEEAKVPPGEEEAEPPAEARAGLKEHPEGGELPPGERPPERLPLGERPSPGERLAPLAAYVHWAISFIL